MNPEEKINPLLGIAVLPPQVWATLDLAQQKGVLQAIVNLCCHIAEKWEEEQDEPLANP